MSFDLNNIVQKMPENRFIELSKRELDGQSRISVKSGWYEDLVAIGKDDKKIHYIGMLDDQDFTYFQLELEQAIHKKSGLYEYRIVKFAGKVVAVLTILNNEENTTLVANIIDKTYVDIVADVPYSDSDEFPMYNGINIFTIKSSTLGDWLF